MKMIAKHLLRLQRRGFLAPTAIRSPSILESNPFVERSRSCSKPTTLIPSHSAFVRFHSNKSEGDEENSSNDGFFGRLDVHHFISEAKPNKEEYTSLTQKQRRKKFQLDRSLYTKKIPIRTIDVEDGDNIIQEWLFKEGDIVVWNDVICEIQTGRIAYGLSVDDDDPSIMGEILYPVGAAVKDDEVICYLLHKEDHSEKEEKSEEE